MTWLYLDIFAGVSGDMFLGALVDVGLSLDVLQDTVAALGLAEAVRVEARRVQKNGIAATKVTVISLGEADAPHAHLRLADEAHHPDHAAHPHAHHGTSHAHHHHPHRTLADILARIERADLPAVVRERAQAVFRRLAEAEARVHGVSPDAVHFHEVGALDAIVDVVGTVMGLHALGITRVVASPVPLSHGYVETAHGRLPVPAPATLALLEGVPVRGVDLAAETVTPTGAALVTTLADAFGPPPRMRVRRVGYGAGTMDLPVPNLLRVLLGEPEPRPEGGVDASTLTVLSTNVDDMPGEWFGPLFERLHAAGALDVWFTPVQMKKGRPGVVITVLAEPEHAPALRDVLLRETTTLGVREQLVTRWCLPREIRTVETPWGPVRVKVARLPDGQIRAKPEFADCERLAREHGLPVWRVVQAALHALKASSPISNLQAPSTNLEA